MDSDNLLYHQTIDMDVLHCFIGLSRRPDTFHTVTFPDDFRFGTALAQWQAEGDYTPEGPVDSNWSQWAAMGRTYGGQTNPEGNGFYWKYEEDIALAKGLGLEIFRLGVDWSQN